MVLFARYVAEDLHNPELPEGQHHDSAEHDSTHLARILNRAEGGDFVAVEAVTQLREDYDIDLYDMIARWNGGHFERDPT